MIPSSLVVWLGLVMRVRMRDRTVIRCRSLSWAMSNPLSPSDMNYLTMSSSWHQNIYLTHRAW